MSDASPPRPRRSWLGVLVNVVACLAVLGASAAAVVAINRTEPTAQQIKSTRKSAALVETVAVERGSYSPRLVVLGTVRPAQQITLSPRVGGQVTEVSSKLVPGGMVGEGDVLVKIDRADFENALSIRQSELAQVEASLEIERGRQTLARKELALLGETIDDANRALVLREPQLASIQAELSAAQAAVERAQLDLQRTEVSAPFDAQVLDRSVDVGSQVGPSDELGTLVGVEQYWIMAAVPLRSLRWVRFPASDGEGSSVVLRDSNAWGPDAERVAEVKQLIGTLDQQTRLARVLITVDDPLGRKSDAPPLILETLVEVEIEGRSIENVVRLDREFVRDRDTVWVMTDGKLEIRPTTVVFRDAEHAYISEGLESGEEVVTSTLATVADGVGLRKVGDAEATSPEGQAAEAADAESETLDSSDGEPE